MTQEWPPGPCPLPAQTPGSWAGGAMQPSVPSGHCCETLRSTPRFRRNSSVSRSSPPPSYPGRSCWRRALRRRRGTPLLEPAGLTLTPLTGTCPPPTQAPSGRQSGPPWPSALDTHSAPWAWTPHQQGIRRPGTPLVLEPLVSPAQNAQVDLPVSSSRREQVWVPLRWTAASKFSLSLGWCSRCHTPFSQTPLGLQVGLCLFYLPLFRGNQAPWQPSSTHRGRQQWRLVPSALMAFLRFPKGGRDAALELFNLLTVTMFFL